MVEKRSSRLITYLVLLALAAAIIAFSYYMGQQVRPILPSRQTQRTEDGLGWGSELMISRRPGQSTQARLLLRDKSAQPVMNAVVKALFEQAGQTTRYEVMLGMSEPGVYRGSIDLPRGGTWQVHVTAEAGKNMYQLNQEYSFNE